MFTGILNSFKQKNTDDLSSIEYTKYKQNKQNIKYPVIYTFTHLIKYNFSFKKGFDSQFEKINKSKMTFGY